jgi:hypothetical protein
VSVLLREEINEGLANLIRGPIRHA